MKLSNVVCDRPASFIRSYTTACGGPRSALPRLARRGVGAWAAMQPLITTLLTLSTLLPPSSAASSYDSLCETIVSHAQAAARLHNSGEAAAAVTEAVASVEAYRSAVELEPSEPQAYLYAGQAMYNMQRFDEAIGAFTAAGEGHPHHGTSAPRHHGTSQESAFLPTGTALAASPGVSTSRRACALRGSARRPSRATRPTPTGRAT